MAFHGYQDLPWAGLDGGVSVADAGVAPSSAGGVDILTVGGKSILPHSVSLSLNADVAAPNVNVYLQFSKDGTVWPLDAGSIAKADFVCNIAEDLTNAANEALVYTRSVLARYMRMFYENNTGGAQAVTMQFDWAPIFGETPSS